MRFVVPKTVTVIWDSNEQYPILFPETILWHSERGSKGKIIRVLKKKKRLLTGDYCLEGYEKGCVIERKGSLDELHKNLLTKDYKRFMKAFGRLVECELPILLLDLSPLEMFRPTYHTPNPAQVFDALVQLLVKTRVSLWYAGHCKTDNARRILGGQLVHLMLRHAITNKGD
jgi:hypothetical protein